MSLDTFTNRNRLIAGLIILIGLLVLIVYFVVSLLSRRTERPRIGHRSPIATLTYCGAELDKLCIVSFSQEVDGRMDVNFQLPDASYPDFILKIIHNGAESTYECQSVKDGFTTVVCIGAPQVPGEVLQFKALSKESSILLAEGEFAIIGIALFTPEAEMTATIEGTAGTPTETPTPTLTAAPVFNTPTSTLTPTAPSYPNPSYP
jgi:hypothetical protein